MFSSTFPPPSAQASSGAASPQQEHAAPRSRLNMPAFERAKAFMLHRHRHYSSGQPGAAASLEHDLHDDNGMEDDDSVSIGSQAREERHERPALVLPRLTSPPERGYLRQGSLAGFHSPQSRGDTQQHRYHLRALQRLRERDEASARRRGGEGSPLVGRYRGSNQDEAAEGVSGAGVSGLGTYHPYAYHQLLFGRDRDRDEGGGGLRGTVEQEDEEEGERDEYAGLRRSVGAGAAEGRAHIGLRRWRRRVGTPVSEGEVVTDDDEDEGGVGEEAGPESDAMRPASSLFASPRGGAEGAESSHARRHRETLRALLQRDGEEEEEEGALAAAQSRAAGGEGGEEAQEEALPILPNALTEHVSLMGFDGSLASSLLPRHVSRLLTGRQASSPSRTPLGDTGAARYGFDESDLVVFYYGLFSDLHNAASSSSSSSQHPSTATAAAGGSGASTTSSSSSSSSSNAREASASPPNGSEGVGPFPPLPRLLHLPPARVPHFPWPVFHMVDYEFGDEGSQRCLDHVLILTLPPHPTEPAAPHALSVGDYEVLLCALLRHMLGPVGHVRHVDIRGAHTGAHTEEDGELADARDAAEQRAAAARRNSRHGDTLAAFVEMGSEEQARRAVGCLDGFPWSTSTILQARRFVDFRNEGSTGEASGPYSETGAGVETDSDASGSVPNTGRSEETAGSSVSAIMTRLLGTTSARSRDEDEPSHGVTGPSCSELNQQEEPPRAEQLLDHPPLDSADVGACATEGLPTNMAKAWQRCLLAERGRSADLLGRLRLAEGRITSLREEAVHKVTTIHHLLDQRENMCRYVRLLRQKIQALSLRNQELERGQTLVDGRVELLQQRLRECEHKMEDATTTLHYHQQQRRDGGSPHRRGEGKEGDESGLEKRLKEGVSDEALGRLQLAELSELESSLSDALYKVRGKREDIIKQQQEQLLRSREEEEATKLCCICVDSAKSVLLLPCRHLCVCQPCAARPELERCPVCREIILQRMPVYA